MATKKGQGKTGVDLANKSNPQEINELTPAPTYILPPSKNYEWEIWRSGCEYAYNGRGIPRPSSSEALRDKKSISFRSMFDLLFGSWFPYFTIDVSNLNFKLSRAWDVTDDVCARLLTELPVAPRRTNMDDPTYKVWSQTEVDRLTVSTGDREKVVKELVIACEEGDIARNPVNNNKSTDANAVYYKSSFLDWCASRWNEISPLRHFLGDQSDVLHEMILKHLPGVKKQPSLNTQKGKRRTLKKQLDDELDKILSVKKNQGLSTKGLRERRPIQKLIKESGVVPEPGKTFFDNIVRNVKKRKGIRWGSHEKRLQHVT